MHYKLAYWIKEFEGVYRGPNWLGDSILDTVTGIPAQSAFRKPFEKRHSICEILKHMMVWKYLLVNRLSGDEIFDVDQEESFEVSLYGEQNEDALKKLLSDFDDCQRELITLLNNASADVLEHPVAGRNYTMGYLINGILQHDVYHLGQLAFLKKQLLESQV